MTARVALDCRLLHWPGIGRYCGEMAAALPAAAPDLEFLWLCNAGDAAKLPVARNATTVTLNSCALGMAEQIEVPWTLRRHQVALLHAPVAFSVPLAAPRFVTTAHDLIYVRFPEFLPNPFARAYYNAMTRWSVARARHMITVSEATRADLIARWPRAALKTTTLLNGVPATLRLPSDKESEHWRNALALPPHYVLYIGTRKRTRICRGSSKPTAVWRRRACRFPLVMVAPPDPRFPEVDATIARLGIAGDIRHLANLPEAALPTLYRGAHCVLLPSLYEGFGLPVAEGYACGTPALVARASSLPEVGGSACVLVDPEDTASIRSGLSRLLNDADLYAQLKARTGFEARRFDWNNVARRVAQIYRDALA